MHRRAREFADAANERYGFEVTVEEFPEGTKTAEDAAAAVGCDVSQIASSLVFDADGSLVVVVTSGANRVDERRLADHLGVSPAAVSMADPERIRDVVGWAIGGVPPFCHASSLPVLFDETLTTHDTVWAAAGTPEAVFPVDPSELRRLADADVVAVAEE
ncbi:YbaK/EbsC family protein [Halogeometricum limi]|uniref:Cys-tRNA(Pro) deacylase, prolyl-tRNA editing enzyme YbaK/EbsC n=1 Tax=Halogeometricum limi TaxID=555875 RepID=A0A1I6GRK9_9EURY|nr:YbaK/EbsC family protein [Halogeometricum limi]SFR44842.1 Cys-tRNA(Pro) deacylase, prolyl-tRNA editing enzyme YbaK/EbsC [Halogeometricum limi]